MKTGIHIYIYIYVAMKAPPPPRVSSLLSSRLSDNTLKKKIAKKLAVRPKPTPALVEHSERNNF